MIAVAAISTALETNTMAEEITNVNDKKTEEIQFAPVKPSNSAEASVKEEIKVDEQIMVAATAYTAECEGCSGTTKTGINLLENPEEKVIAVDPDIIPLGTKVYVEGYGYAIAGDIGGGINGHEIDIFIPEEKDAIEWGRQQVKVAIVEE